MNNKIKNPKTEVLEALEMNDKDYITTMLTIEKGMVKDYVVALTEASNTDLYNDYYDMFNEIISLQREIYNLMFKKGWYEIEKAEENKITQKLNSLKESMFELDK